MEFDIYKLVDKYRLSRTEQEILQFILDHSDEALDLNVRKIAKMNYTSPTTIIRLAQKLGYKGYTDMAYRINFAVHDTAEQIPIPKVSPAIVNMEYILANVTLQDIRSFIQVMKEADQAPIYVDGVGFSQPIAQYITKKLLVLGYCAVFTDSFELYENNRLGARAAFLISRTGETYEIVKSAKFASANGISVISFTGDQPTTTAQNSLINFKF